MSDFHVAIDIDDVVFDFSGGWRDAYCTQFHTVPTPKNELTFGSLARDTHFEGDEEWFDWAQKIDLWDRLEMLPGAEDGINQLIAEYEVSFVTARHGYGAERIRAWHAQHEWGGLTKMVTDSKDKTEVGAHVYIDDRPKTLLRVHEVGAVPICFLRPWNDSARKWPAGPPAEVLVAGDWGRVVDLVGESFEIWVEP